MRDRGVSMEYRVLGPVEVWRDGVVAGALPPRQRALLAALLIDAGRYVPFDVVVDRVWGDRDGGASQITLHATVSKLRKALAGTDELSTSGAGYRLQVPTGGLDALEFEHDVARARRLAADDPAGARAAVRAALDRWRGPAYADVTAAFAADEAARLEEQRQGALELAAELDLVLGRHARLVEELPALVRAQPLRERLRACLMLALYRSGRQADALALYAETRALLDRELGVDPDRELQTLHEQVLRQDPALDLPAAPPPAVRRQAVPVAAAPRLPVALTSFLGRERELAQLRQAVRTRRLLTLVGPGGSGKTRLALEAARTETPRTVHLVELAGTDDGAFVVSEIASSLGVGLTGGDALDAVTAALGDREVLLLLDNCEHLLDVVADVCLTLLSRVPGLTVLATSREPLGVPGEAVVPVGPMLVDGPGSDAVRLFLDRAALVTPPVEDPAELGLVTGICRELDGLPLAVELAAACLATLPLQEVAARVSDRFTLLSSGWRTAPPHQRTLAATVQWSVDLLTPQDREVFCALSVFHGSFGADAVEAVLEPGRAAVPALRALVAKSLVELDHRTGRYRLLETLRHFADDSLDDDVRLRLRDRHAACHAGLVEGIEPTLRRRDGADGWKRLDAEQADLRAAMAHALAVRDRVTALRIAACLSWWWFRRGHVQEGRQWLEAVLADPPGEPAALLARARFGLGMLAYLQGDVETITDLTDQVIEIPLGVDDGLLALALVLRGFVRSLLAQEDFPGQARQQAQRGIDIAATCGVDWFQPEIAMTLGQFARAAGEPQVALGHLERAARAADEVGHTWAWVSSEWVRSKVLIDLGDGAAALRVLVPVLDANLRESDATSALAGLLAAAGAATTVGLPHEAAQLLGAIGQLGRTIGYDPLAMDLLDGHRYLQSTVDALPAAELEAAQAYGRTLDLRAATELVRTLAAYAPLGVELVPHLPRPTSDLPH